MAKPALKIVSGAEKSAPAALPEIELIWDDTTVGGWKELLQKAPRSNLAQTFQLEYLKIDFVLSSQEL